MASEHLWSWTKGKRKHYKVISDPERGVIEIYNEHGDIVLRKENLSRRLVELIEKNFLATVATRIYERTVSRPPRPPASDPFDPMIT